MRLASSSAAATSVADTSRARSIVDDRRAEVEALGAHAKQAIERRRQHVLPRVLLHVIEPPRPVDGAATTSPGFSVPDDHVRDARRPRDR